MSAYTLQCGRLASADGHTQLATYAFLPHTAPCAVVQVLHGMCEHMMRYENLAESLCARGIALIGHDHLGHGKSAPTEEELGYIAHRGGDRLLVADARRMTEQIRRDYPELPIVLLGHSMGSFVARAYLAEKPPFAAAVLSGTAGPESPTGAGHLLARLIAAVRGEKHRSKLLYTLAFGSYTKRYPWGAGEHYWISSDERVQAAYGADPFCTYRFTASAYADLFALLGRVSRRSWARELDRDMPILMLSGGKDPVGNYGKGVTVVYNRLKKAGVADVTLKIYENDCHEVFNELDRDAVISDLCEWLTLQGCMKEGTF